ncbi:acyl-CoA dehydrogenase [Mycobacteroides abscessus]|uniref:acyl-CoA dehydrogenase n=1 Tax=Mycobacteroides abscessus TaxID=36809 RepID=UPI000C265817|nr:acyl-CoA dehydrogenase [Mycobacteroides abscessus]
MGHYKSNLRNIEFNLFEVLDLGRVLDSGAYTGLDAETLRDMLRNIRDITEGPLADSYADADRNPPAFDAATHSVRLPESFKKSYMALWEAGWELLGAHEDLGGTAMPRAAYWALSELVLGSNPAAYIYALGPALSSLFTTGSAQQQAVVKAMVDNLWGGTMVLTEPDAGSDVGSARTKAIPQPDGTWHIEGVKRFISSGDSDLFDNIVHLVLARPEGAPPGTKGLSLFLVPKHRFDLATGELGERNGVFATNLEHKMGLKASATCELTFGAHGIPATAWLVGDLNNGIAQMFRVIEHARMMVGTKAISTLSSGYLHALDYAKQRIQGPDLTHAGDKTAPRVTIIQHPDVRRSLMLQKAYTEGMRALYLYTAAHQDPAIAEQVSGADPELAARINDLLLPIVKGVGSERAYQYLAESLQTFGGSGYLQDYPIEQYIRDSKIDTVYEGTTAIRPKISCFRKIVRDGGGALKHILQQITAFIENPCGAERISGERSLLAAALTDVQSMTGALTVRLMNASETPAELYKIGLASVRYLMAVGDLLIGWQLLRHAEIAAVALQNSAALSQSAFYQGKIVAAQYFARNVLPTLAATRSILNFIDNEIMEINESAF